MFEVQIHTSNEGCSIINIYSQRGPGYGWHVAKPITLEFERLEEGQVHEPTLKMSSLEGPYLMDAFRKALSKTKEEEDSVAKLKGEIKAMRAHIEDLKTLLQIREEAKSGRLLRPKE